MGIYFNDGYVLWTNFYFPKYWIESIFKKIRHLEIEITSIIDLISLNYAINYFLGGAI